MIKGLYSLKSLKLFGTGFLISCFILLGSFVSAINGQVVAVDGFVASTFDSSYNMKVGSNGVLQSSFLGQGKQMLMSFIGRYFFFLQDGTPYIGSSTLSNGDWHEEGVPGNFLICDTLSLSDTEPSNCQGYTLSIYSGYIFNFYRFLDKRYYGSFTEDGISGRQGNLVCFSSNQIGKSLCFYSCSHPNCGSDYTDKIGGFRPISNLRNSRNFGTEFGSIPDSQLGFYPGFWSGTSISGGNSTASNSYLSGNLTYSTCSNGYVLTQIDNLLGGQWRYTCMAGISETGVELNASTMATLNYNPGQGADFKVVYNLTNEGLNWGNWFSKYSSIYNQWYYNQSVYATNPFYGKNALLFAYFKTLNDYGYNDSIYSFDLLNACKLLLYSDWNSQYSGSYFRSVCINNIGQGGNGGESGGGNYTTGEVGSVDDNNEVLPPGYNQDNNSDNNGTAVGSSWAGVISGHDNETNYDGTTFINDYFQKLKSTYIKPGGNVVGSLPSYILIFLCGIMLFKFIRK